MPARGVRGRGGGRGREGRVGGLWRQRRIEAVLLYHLLRESIVCVTHAVGECSRRVERAAAPAAGAQCSCVGQSEYVERASEEVCELENWQTTIQIRLDPQHVDQAARTQHIISLKSTRDTAARHSTRILIHASRPKPTAHNTRYRRHHTKNQTPKAEALTRCLDAWPVARTGERRCASHGSAPPGAPPWPARTRRRRRRRRRLAPRHIKGTRSRRLVLCPRP